MAVDECELEFAADGWLFSLPGIVCVDSSGALREMATAGFFWLMGDLSSDGEWSFVTKSFDN
ncbi:MAG TPA: hypothetical protein VNA16_03470 [Abditibacteriaceae bacterium]|nr:hypothetical protein [Abditibacteriaceae bacterium]